MRNIITISRTAVNNVFYVGLVLLVLTVSAVAPWNGSSAFADGDVPIDWSEPILTDANDDHLTGAYTKFEISQTALNSMSGVIRVSADGLEDSRTYSTVPGEPFVTSVVFPELKGNYRLEMLSEGKADPVLWVDGNIRETGDGKYAHRFINGDADAELLKLNPSDVGMKISIGEVRARLSSCVELYEPIQAIYNVGVDVNGDKQIDESELRSEVLSQSTSACVETADNRLPLTSMYTAQVLTDQGDIVAQNLGEYDFINRASLTSDRQSDVDRVREFAVQWHRTPVETAIEIPNNLLRSPAREVQVVAKAEEVTRDIINNDPSFTGYKSQVEEQEETESLEESSSTPTSLSKYWYWGLGALGTLLTIGILAKARPKKLFK